MPPPTFIQESRLGRWIFQIRDGALHLSVARFGRGFDEYRVDLRRVSPEYKPRTMRMNFHLALAGGLFVLCSLAVWGAHQQEIVPHEALSHFLHWPYHGIALSLIMAWRYMRRVEFFQFYDHQGEPLFVIARERDQAAECESFILNLISHIELSQSSLSAAAQEGLLRQLARNEAPSLQAKSEVALWQLSLVLGGLASGLPWIPGLAYFFDLFQFMIVFWLCVGGAACSVFSYTKKERYRHWSALGLVLSLIPPFFY